MKTPPPAPWQGPEAHAIRPALEALGHARQRVASIRPHRGLVRLEPGAFAVQAIVLPAIFIALLLHCEPWLLEFWRLFVMTWAEPLGLPLRVSAREAGWGELRLVWSYLEAPTGLPGNFALWVSALVTLAFFAVTYVLPPRMIPLKYVLRILCGVQGVSVAFFALGGEFPYGVQDHVLALSSGGFVLMVAIPAMLAMGYYVLRVPVVMKVLHTFLILGYFTLLVPLQVVMHVVLLQHFGVIVMPLLYFCFGAVLNFVLFVALYSWVASTAPEDAAAPRLKSHKT